jgi:hypothetical protein
VLTCSQARIKNWTALRRVNGINGSSEMVRRNIRRHDAFTAPKTAMSSRWTSSVSPACMNRK